MVLKRHRGVIGKYNPVFQNGLSKNRLENLDAFIHLHQPSRLRRPGNLYLLPLKDDILTVQRQMIGKLADNHMGQKPHIRLAFGNGRIRQGGTDHAIVIG
ncbi:MAG: hypothetical protein BWX99_01249 [Deltaproteobacteria bacterium ADurb.Bin151]|nr:MAG: hypothetical protein BWX99_01249 [Deltaproteobacteria bacterium ADurb.Bin151]